MPGPFYFAWVGEDETTFGPEHLVWDEEIVEFSLRQVENDFCTLTLTILNPRTNLLDPGWAWFSWDPGDGTPMAAFFGQVMRVPEDMRESLLQIVLRARPLDFDDAKETLAATLRTLPEWDPVVINAEAREDPDSVLLARTKSWHVDRVTHALTVSDNHVGEDGTLTYGPSDVFYSSVRMRVGEAPVNRVVVNAQIDFTQRGAGYIDISPDILTAFAAAGSVAKPGWIDSYSMEDIVDSWPTIGQQIGAGWSVSNSNITNGNHRAVNSDFIADNSLFGFISMEFKTTFQTFTGRFGSIVEDVQRVRYERGIALPYLEVQWVAERSFTELISFTVDADLQAVDANDVDPIRLDFSANDINEGIDIGGLAPLRDERRNSYIKTDRGLQTLQYMLLRGRAELLDHARCVEIDFSVKFEKFLEVTCRKNVSITDARLPGGSASGKIIGYEARGSGDGSFSLTITIGCCIGRGQTVSGSAGTGDYIEDDYIEPDYQVHIGKVNLLPPGDITHDDISAVVIDDDGLNLFTMDRTQGVQSIEVENGSGVQAAIIKEAGKRQYGDSLFEQNLEFGELAGFFSSEADAAEPLYNSPTCMTIELTELNTGPFSTTFNVTTSLLMVPSQIDLEAA